MKTKSVISWEELYNIFKNCSIQDIEKIPEIKENINDTLIAFSKNSKIKSIKQSPIVVSTATNSDSALFYYTTTRVNGSIETWINIIANFRFSTLHNKIISENNRKNSIFGIFEGKYLSDDVMNFYLQSGKSSDDYKCITFKFSIFKKTKFLETAPVI